MSRQIAVQPWERVAANYPAETHEQLAGMMSGFRPAHGGQLVLWQGVPGTGKTHALRALAWEWREWADLHYVIDPDEMFGAHADYLVRVLLSGGDDGAVLVTAGKESPVEPGARWQVIVLEDTGEMLAADAKQRVGHALSRLLNTVDGLIGQGLRVLVLVTTNEELKTLHPAIQRPGRCAARIEFGRFSQAEAEAWLDGRGLDLFNSDGQHAAVASDVTLAELYALAEDFASGPAKRAVGFAAA